MTRVIKVPLDLPSIIWDQYPMKSRDELTRIYNIVLDNISKGFKQMDITLEDRTATGQKVAFFNVGKYKKLPNCWGIIKETDGKDVIGRSKPNRLKMRLEKCLVIP